MKDYWGVLIELLDLNLNHDSLELEVSTVRTEKKGQNEIIFWVCVWESWVWVSALMITKKYSAAQNTICSNDFVSKKIG